MGEVKLPSAEEVVEQIYLAIDARDGRCLNEAVGKLYQYRDALLEAAAEVADVYGTPDSLLSCIPDAIAAEIRKLKDELK